MNLARGFDRCIVILYVFVLIFCGIIILVLSGLCEVLSPLVILSVATCTIHNACCQCMLAMVSAQLLETVCLRIFQLHYIYLFIIKSYTKYKIQNKMHTTNQMSNRIGDVSLR